MRQTYRPIKVILVDDHSEDGTRELIDNFYKEFDKNNIVFKYIYNERKLYCGSSYNLALKGSGGGDYFGVVDSDDMLEPFACKYVANLYEKHKQVTWIYTQHNKYNRKMDRIVKRGFCHAPGKGKSIFYLEKKGYNVFSHWRTFSNRLPDQRSIFKKGLRCCVDKYMGYRMEELGIGMFAKKVCYRYRRRNKGENPISFAEPLQRTRATVIREVRERRKQSGNNIFPILKHR
jgi:glycosyltransferase involved in cell wall biosynthesis